MAESFYSSLGQFQSEEELIQGTPPARCVEPNPAPASWTSRQAAAARFHDNMAAGVRVWVNCGRCWMLMWGARVCGARARPLNTRTLDARVAPAKGMCLAGRARRRHMLVSCSDGAGQRQRMTWRQHAAEDDVCNLGCARGVRSWDVRCVCSGGAGRSRRGRLAVKYVSCTTAPRPETQCCLLVASLPCPDVSGPASRPETLRELYADSQ